MHAVLDREHRLIAVWQILVQPLEQRFSEQFFELPLFFKSAIVFDHFLKRFFQGIVAKQRRQLMVVADEDDFLAFQHRQQQFRRCRFRHFIDNDHIEYRIIIDKILASGRNTCRADDVRMLDVHFPDFIQIVLVRPFQ